MLNNSNTIFYVVNLEKDKNRKENVLVQLKKQNINNFKFVKAVDGNKLTDEELKNHVFQNKKNSYKWHIKLSNPEIGCALSHIKIYEDFINSKYQLAVVFEDDILFKYNFDNEIKTLIFDCFSRKKQILLLGELKQFFKKALIKSQRFKIVNTETAYSTFAYVINKEAARAILDFNYPIKTVADNHLLWKLYLGINVYGIDPIFIDHDNNFQSNIEHLTIFDEIKAIEKQTPFYRKQILWRRKLYKLQIKILKIILPFLFGTHFKGHTK